MEAVAQARAKQAAEVDFRESLRQFGRWFADEARNRGLKTIPFYAAQPKLLPPKYSKGFLGFGGNKLVEEARYEPPIAVARGWAIHAQGGISPSRRSIGGRVTESGSVDGGTTLYYCLAVDTDGGVQQAHASSDAAYLSSDAIDDLKRFDVVMAAGLYVNHPSAGQLGLSLVDPTYISLSSAAYEANNAVEENVLSHFIASAHQRLGTAES